MSAPDSGPRVVRVEAPRVEGTIALEDIARRLQAAAQQAAAARTGPRFFTAGPGSAPDEAQRLARLGELAGRLADELGDLPPGLLEDEPGGRP